MPSNTYKFSMNERVQFSLTISDILTGLEYETDDEMSNIRHGNGEQGRETETLPFEVGFNTPETICFTRTSNDSLNTHRVKDWIAFSNSVFGNARFYGVTIRIFVHYPNQLVRSFHKPIFKSAVGFQKFGIRDQTRFWRMLLKGKVKGIGIWLRSKNR